MLFTFFNVQTFFSILPLSMIIPKFLKIIVFMTNPLKKGNFDFMQISMQFLSSMYVWLTNFYTLVEWKILDSTLRDRLLMFFYHVLRRIDSRGDCLRQRNPS